MHVESDLKVKAVKVRVKIVCPEENPATLGRAISLAISPLKAAFRLEPGKVRHTWVLTLWSLDVDLTKKNVCDALSTIDTLWIDGKVHPRGFNLPILKHVRKAATSACKCKTLFCKHIPKWTPKRCKCKERGCKHNIEALAAFKREDRRNERRCEQRNRVDDVFPHGKGKRKPRIKK